MRPTVTSLPRSIFLTTLAVVALLPALGAAPAQAGPGDWTSLAGLSDNGGPAINNPSWVRTFATGTPPTTIYAGTDGAGVWKSVNDGLTWSQYSNGLDSDSLEINQIYTSGGNVYAATSGGLWSAPDSISFSGSWSPVAQGPETDPEHPTKLETAVENVISVPGAMLAGSFSEGVYRSTDGGQTWQPPSPDNGMPQDGLTVWSFASFQNFVWAATTDGIFRSADSGATWTLSSDGIPASATTLGVVQDTGNPLIYYAETASDGLYRSIDGGTSWQSIDADGSSEPFGGGSTPTVHAIQEFSGQTQTRLYVATSNGLWVGTLPNVFVKPAGQSLQVPGTPIWRNVTSQGFSVTNPIIWGLSTFTNVPGTLLAGTENNGGYTLTFQPPSNDGQPANLPSWLAAGILKLDVGTQLIGTTGNWTGTPTIDYSWQWQRCTSSSAGTCSDISGASDQTYTLAPADQGHYIREVVTASNDFPSFPKVPYTASSVVAGPVGAAPGPLPGTSQQDAPEVTDPSGDIFLPTEGDTLAAPGGQAGGAGGWYFNPAGNVIIYQWLRCDGNGANCAEIPGATNSTYTLTAADDASTIEVEVSAENQYGQSFPLVSGATNPIIPAPAQATVLPSLSDNAHTGGTPANRPTSGGNAYVGHLISGDVGAWASPATYWTRQWLQCDPQGDACSPIAGATGSDYVPNDDDVGMTLRLEITADVNPADQLPDPTVVDTDPSGVVTYAPGSPAPAPASGGSGSGTGGGNNTGSSGNTGGGSSSGGHTTPTSTPTAPQLGAVKLASTGRALTFTLTAAGSVTLLLQRAEKGHRQGVRCLTGAAHKKAKRCTAYVTVAGVARSGLAAGAGSIALPTKVHGHLLPPGTYRVVLEPSGPGDTAGAPVTIPLVLARG